ncbi:MAG: methyltransferase domain-containing protein [Patescibacteria group bacterium]
MLNKSLRKIANYQDNKSFALKLREKRNIIFKNFISGLSRPVHILDVGGTEVYWQKMGFAGNNDYQITVLNIFKNKQGSSNVKSVAGDARNMKEFKDKHFDVVFSNSVIEHVGDFDDQNKMAKEIKRIGKKYFLQTPNYYFPIEPHFLFPLFQFFPIWFKVFLIRHFNLGWREKTPTKEDALKNAKSVRLLTEKELKDLFPEAKIINEKVLGFTKSFIVYK